MSCFGGLSPVLSNIGHVLKLHCGTIVCAPGVSGQEGLDPTALSGSTNVQDLAIDAALGNPKGMPLFNHKPFSCMPRSYSLPPVASSWLVQQVPKGLICRHISPKRVHES